MLYVATLKLKEGKERQYKAWCLRAAKEYQKRVPSGWKLVGIYGSTMSLADFDVAWVWRFKTWSDWDAYFALEDKVMDKLMEEENKFFLPGSVRAVVMREMEDWYAPIKKVKKK